MELGHDQRSKRFFEAVARRDGIFSWSQATEFGLSKSDIAAGLRNGSWRRYEGVYQLAGANTTDQSRLRAVLIRAGKDALATGPSALALWKFDAIGDGWKQHGRPYIQIPPNRHLELEGVEILREPAPTCRTIDGIDVVTRDKAVIDSLRLLPDEDGREVLHRALQLRWIDLQKLEYWTALLFRRRGVAQLKAHLADARTGTHAESERRMVRILRRARIKGWQVNVAVHDEAGLIGYGDFVFEKSRIVLEVDGRAWHTTPDRFQRDRTRQNRLVKAGWKVLRYTWQDLTERPDQIAMQIKSLVR